MTKPDGKIAGILGAIIIHLIAGIIFMLVKIGNLNVDKRTREYQIALEEIPEPEKKVPLQDQQQGTSVEKIFREDPEILNIARNIANQPDVKINKSDYIDKVKEELIAAGKLGKDNYIDEQKKAKENNQSNVIIEKKEDQKAPEKQNSSQQIAANYSGPTRIYYNLRGRNHVYMPIPIYKCEGSGKAVLSIEVDQKGNVISAKIIPAESTTSDPCLTEAATSSALNSKFNPDINAAKIQTGTITYHFVAQ